MNCPNENQYGIRLRQLKKSANNVQLIRAVWFLKQRKKKPIVDDSDLDVVIELLYTDPDSALAHWMSGRELAKRNTTQSPLICGTC